MSDFTQTDLPGGERVISERLDHVRSAAIGYWIDVGSRDERDEQAGVSHFIEHLLFKGSSGYSALAIAEIFDELGSELNAATSRDHTVVYARVPDTGIATALEVIGDMVCAPLFEDLDTEREVVLEEIAMYEDTPQDLVHDLIGEAIFGADSLGRRVIGSAEVISTVSPGALRDFHDAYYAPGRIVVAAAGQVDHDELVAHVQRSATARATRSSLRPTDPELLATTPTPGCVFQRKETEQVHVCLGAPGVSRTDPRRFVAAVLDAILGGSASSRLFQEIREKRGLAYAVYSFLSQYAETGQIGIYVGTREENLGQALAIACDQIGDIASGSLPAAELHRAKENLKGRTLLSMESTSARMHRLGKARITGADLLSFAEVIAEIEAVDAEGVCALAAELLDPTRLSVAAIGPNEERFRAALDAVIPSLATA